MDKLADFYPPSGVASIGTTMVDKFGNYSFKISNNNQFPKVKKTITPRVISIFHGSRLGKVEMIAATPAAD